MDFLNLDPNFAKKVGFKEVEINYAGDLSKIDHNAEKEISHTSGLVRGRIKELERKRNLGTLTEKEEQILDQLKDSYNKLEKTLDGEIYTKRGARNRYLKKIGLDFFEYNSKWKGATYFDIWGGDNRYCGRTIDSVDGSKGHNYPAVLDLVAKVKNKLKKNQE